MENTLEYIESYFQNELPATERLAFEEKCTNDESFAGEVAFYVTSRQVLREALLKDKQSAWSSLQADAGSTVAAPAKTISLFRKLAPYAAAACLILAVLLVYLNNSNSTVKYADNYIQKNIASISQTMNGSADSLQLGIEAYNKQDYDKALIYFKGVSANDPLAGDSKKYTGYTYLLTKKYDEALAAFGELANMKGLYGNPGNFLMAVTLIKRNTTGDKEQAKKLLQLVVNEKSGNMKEAEDVLDKLK